MLDWGGNLPLGERWLAIQAVPQGDDPGLPFGETLSHTPADLGAGVPGVQILQHVVFHADDIHQGEGAAVPVAVQGVREGDLSLELPLGAEVHQDFIFNAPAGIGGQPDIFIRFEGGDALDEPDGPNGDQVVLIPDWV